MDFKSLINSLDTISENTTVNKGTYGTSHGKEDVRDQYGQRIGKIDKGAVAKKDAPKKGRGRPKKGSDEAGEVKSYDTKSLSSVFGGGQQPKGKVGTVSKKHSLKEYIEEAEHAINEDMNSRDSIQIKPASQTNTKVIQQGNQTLGTVSNPQLANQIEQAISKDEITFTGAGQAMSENDEEMNQDREHDGQDSAKYSMEGDFVKTQLHTIARSTRELEERINDQEDLPEWVQMKISQAQGMLSSVSDYIDSEKERDVERGTGHEVMVSEKAKSKAQQRFFGMVHAMQKGKEVSGASKGVTGVAKSIGKQDAKDFAKTKHKGLPSHVNETSFEDQDVMEGSGYDGSTPLDLNTNPSVNDVFKRALYIYDYEGYGNDMDYSEDDAIEQYVARKFGQDVLDQLTTAKNQQYFGRADGKGPGGGGRTSNLGTSSAPGGNFRTTKAGVMNKQDAKMMKNRVANRLGHHPEPMLPEDVTEGFPRIQAAIKKYTQPGVNKLAKLGREGASKKKMAATRKEFNQYEKKEVAESTNMKNITLTESAIKDLLINLYDDIYSHMDDGTIFDLKKAKNVQQAEEIIKALVKHGEEYDGLDNSSQNELVNYALKYLAHEEELPFNTFNNVDKQRFANRTPKDFSRYNQYPGAKPGSNFSKPGSPMAVPRTAPSTGSNGFLKTLNTNSTFNESNDMKDKQFENWENKLNSLLTEGITVSHSTGQQGSPDSLSVNATENDATELMSILRNSGMEMFGGKQQAVSYGSSEHDGEENSEEFHQGIEIAPSPEVVGDGSDMLALIKKMSGISTDSNTPGSVEVDYEPEGEEEVDEGYEETDEGAGVMHYKKEQAQKAGQDHFKLGGEEYPVKEDEIDEGNFYAHNVLKAKQAGKQEADLDGDGDMEQVKEEDMEESHDHEEGQETCNECGGAMYEGHSCSDEQVEEGYANEAGHEELAELKTLLSMGNDLHREKRTQATGNIQKVTMETKLLKNSTELLTDWKKLSGIK